MITEKNFGNIISSVNPPSTVWLVLLSFVFFLVYQIISIGFHSVVAAEEYWWIAPDSWAVSFETLWALSDNFGLVHSQTPYMFPQGIFFIFCSKLSLPIALSQKIWFAALQTCSFMGIINLCLLYKGKSDLHHKKNINIPILIAAITYIYSPYFLSISPLLSSPKIVHSVMPLLLFYCFTYNPNKILSGFPIFLCLCFSTTAWVNPPQAIILLLPVALRCVFDLREIKRIRLNSLWKISKLPILSLLALIPIIWALVSYLQAGGLNDLTTHQFNRQLFDSAQLFDVFRLTGSWAFHQSFDGVPYFDYAFLYADSLFYNLFPLLLLLLASNIVVNAGDKRSAKLIILGLLLAILSSGFSPLFSFYELMLKTIPSLVIFREPFAKFGLLVCFLYTLICFVVSDFLNSKFNDKNILRLLTQYLFFTAIIFYQLPVINNDVVRNLESSVRSEIVKVPASYQNLAHVSGKPLVLFPKSSYVTGHFWGNGYSGNPIYLKHDTMVLQYNSGWIRNDKTELINKIIELAYIDLASAVSLLNGHGVETFVFRKDIITSYTRDNIELLTIFKNAEFCDSVNENEHFDIFTCKQPTLTADKVPSQQPSHILPITFRNSIFLNLKSLLAPIFGSLNLQNFYTSIEINEFSRFNMSFNKELVVMCSNTQIQTYKSIENFLSIRTLDCEDKFSLSIFHWPSIIFAALLSLQMVVILCVLVTLIFKELITNNLK